MAFDYEQELERIFRKHSTHLLDNVHDISYRGNVQDDVHEAAELYIAEKYGREVLNDPEWMEEYFDEVADIIVPMMEDLSARAVAEYFDTDAGRDFRRNSEPQRRAEEVLYECADLMAKKGAAYNGFPQAEYYPYGLRDIWYMCFTKVKRLESQIVRDGEANFEGVEDSARDLINYAAFLIEYAEGKMNGQKK